jgi:mRNA interferase MazF
MATFKPFDIVAAPFPYVERPILQRRPCLIVGEPEKTGLVWVIMITSAKNEVWQDDVHIEHLDQAGLKAASIIRTAKIVTVETSALKVVGHLDDKTKALVVKKLLKHWKLPLDSK